jgi:hypothetical protein
MKIEPFRGLFVDGRLHRYDASGLSPSVIYGGSLVGELEDENIYELDGVYYSVTPVGVFLLLRNSQVMNEDVQIG